MKVGLLTIHNCENFGAVLQASATMHLLDMIGINAELINYSTPDLIEANKLFKISMKPRSILNNIRYLVKRNEYNERRKKFNVYKSQYYRTGEVVVSDKNDGAGLNQQYDAIIVGSDQTFNLHLYGDPEYRKIYFLDQYNGKKYSLSSSFGECTDKLSEDEKQFIAKAISKFSFVSVRDQRSQTFLQEISDTKPVLLLDPTMMVEKSFWNDLCIDIFKEDYILFYTVLSEPWVVKMVHDISKKTGLRVVAIHLPNRYELNETFNRYINCGPIEFLSLIKNAKLVLTTSFHATVFSLLFNKEFWSFKIGEGNRIGSLLSMVGLSERMITRMQDDSFINKDKIQYDTVNSILEMEREKSISILRKALVNDGNM